MSDTGSYGWAGGSPDRRLPANEEAEQALLGMLLLDNRHAENMGVELRPEHFHVTAHQRIYGAVKGLLDGGRGASPVTLKRHFEQDDSLSEIGGTAYLARLAASAPSYGSSRDLAAVIRECWEGRELIALADTVIERAQGMGLGDGAGVALRAEIEARLYEMGRETAALTGLRPLAEFLDPALQAAQDAYQNQGVLPGVTTGLEKLDALLGGYQPAELTIVAGRPGMGKAQPIDTPVLTPRGWVPIGTLKVGDFVFGVDGLPTRVSGIYPQGMRPAFRVSFRDGTSVECCDEHLWSVASGGGRSRGKFVVKSLKVLMGGGLCNPRAAGRRVGAKWHIPVADPVHFPERVLPVDPYVLGVLIGDGSTSRINNMGFSNPDMDSDIRGRVADRLPAGLRLAENRSPACPYFGVRGDGIRHFKAAIVDLGLNVKSPAKFIPDSYKLGSVVQRLDLLRGLMDTDGSCLANRTTFHTTAKRLANDVAGLVRSLGGLANIRTYDRSREGKPTEYCVNVKMKTCPFYTSRKLAQWAPQQPTRYIRSAVPSRVVEQVCISVEAPDGLYLTDNFVVTHNTTKAKTAVYRAAQGGKICAVFSLDMSGVQLAQWFLADPTGISASRMRRGELDQDDIHALVMAADDQRVLPVFIDDRPGLSVGQMAGSVRRLKKRLGRVDLVVVDHLGHGKAEGGGGQNRVGEITEITGALLRLAKEEDVAVVALSQLSRKVEERDDKRPMLSDLRDSGSIEQDAAVVLFVYRAEYYLTRSEPVQKPGEKAEPFAERRRIWQDMLDRSRGLVEVIVAKQRSGPTATVKALFEPQHARFSDLAEYQDEGGYAGPLI